MSYNRHIFKNINLGKFTKPNPYKGDIIVDPAGQYKFPGQPTRIPSNDITMQGVPYPVFAQPNVGPGMMMYPGGEYEFPGADYVDELPMAQKGDPGNQGCPEGMYWSNMLGRCASQAEILQVYRDTAHRYGTNQKGLDGKSLNNEFQTAYRDYNKTGEHLLDGPSMTGYHIGQNLRSVFNSMFGTSYKSGGQLPMARKGRNIPKAEREATIVSGGQEAFDKWAQEIGSRMPAKPAFKRPARYEDYESKTGWNRGGMSDEERAYEREWLEKYQYPRQGHPGLTVADVEAGNYPGGYGTGRWVDRGFGTHGITDTRDRGFYDLGYPGTQDRGFQTGLDMLLSQGPGSFQYLPTNPSKGNFLETLLQNLSNTPPVKWPVTSSRPSSAIPWPTVGTRPSTAYRDSLRPWLFEDGGYIELELDDDQIKAYKAGGYVVEELPKAQTGETGSQLYKDQLTAYTNFKPMVEWFNAPRTYEDVEGSYHDWNKMTQKYLDENKEVLDRIQKATGKHPFFDAERIPHKTIDYAMPIISKPVAREASIFANVGKLPIKSIRQEPELIQRNFPPVPDPEPLELAYRTQTVINKDGTKNIITVPYAAKDKGQWDLMDTPRVIDKRKLKKGGIPKYQDVGEVSYYEGEGPYQDVINWFKGDIESRGLDIGKYYDWESEEGRGKWKKARGADFYPHAVLNKKTGEVEKIRINYVNPDGGGVILTPYNPEDPQKNTFQPVPDVNPEWQLYRTVDSGKAFSTNPEINKAIMAKTFNPKLIGAADVEFMPRSLFRPRLSESDEIKRYGGQPCYKCGAEVYHRVMKGGGSYVDTELTDEEIKLLNSIGVNTEFI